MNAEFGALLRKLCTEFADAANINADYVFA